MVCLALRRHVLAYKPVDERYAGEPAEPKLAQHTFTWGLKMLVAGHRPIALAAGYLDPRPAELVRAIRKQVRG